MEIRAGKNFTAYMKGVRKRTLDVVAQIPAEKEHWQLGEGMSPVAIVLHIGQTEQALWGSALKDGKAGPLREPSQQAASTLSEAVAFMTDLRREDEDYWTGLGETELASEITGPTGDRMVLSRWLTLAAEHEIHHRSFLHAYRKIWGLPPHPIYGLTLEGLKEMLK